MNLRILDEAAAELADAISRYESIESGLGVRLKQEVKAALVFHEPILSLHSLINTVKLN